MGMQVDLDIPGPGTFYGFSSAYQGSRLDATAKISTKLFSGGKAVFEKLQIAIVQPDAANGMPVCYFPRVPLCDGLVGLIEQLRTFQGDRAAANMHLANLSALQTIYDRATLQPIFCAGIVFEAMDGPQGPGLPHALAYRLVSPEQ